jgi:hypothetical protein
MNDKLLTKKVIFMIIITTKNIKNKNKKSINIIYTYSIYFTKTLTIQISVETKKLLNLIHLNFIIIMNLIMMNNLLS